MPTTDTSPVWVGFDLGGTKMLAVVCDDQPTPQVLGKRRRKTKGTDGAKAGISRICSTIEQALEDAAVDPKRLAGIGIGCPGPVDPSKGVILKAVNLGWDNVPIVHQLSEHFGCPTFALNDVDAGVYGEYQFGIAKSARCVVGIFPGTGVGAGCVYDGTILHGRNITCMELGHTKISNRSSPTGFAMTGTVESEASRLSIAAEAAKIAYRGDAPYLLKTAGTNLSDIRSKVLADAIENGDDAIRDLIIQASKYLGMAVVNVVHLLAPDKIVLGGGLVEAIEDLIVSTVQKTAQQNCLPPYKGTFDVAAAKLGDDAVVLGALAWSRRMALASE